MAGVTRRAVIFAALATAVAAVGYPLVQRGRRAALVDATFEAPLPAPQAGMRVYHLGHSLVGRDMPAMLAQLADAAFGAAGAHRYESQLGWGSSLRDHWEPDVPVNGFAEENAHDRFRDARDAIGSGDYDAVVLTEMVEIKDAIRYHDSGAYAARWAGLAREGSFRARVYLYETWHHTDDPAGWLDRIDGDLEAQWLDGVLYPALGASPVHLVPGGQVMAAFVRAARDAGLGAFSSPADLMDDAPDGTRDTIHFNDLGAYLVALTHFAVLYHRDPAGLPHALMLADGTPAQTPTPEVAALMQRVVWDVVRQRRETGVAA